MSDLPPAEGSAEKPFVENPYTALLKEVHWGGQFVVGVNFRFAVAGGEFDALTNTILLRGAKTWTEAKTLSSDRTDYDNRAGAYGNPTTGTDANGKPIKTPTFVLGGIHVMYTHGGSGPGFVWNAWMETTTDGGNKWTRSYEAENGFVVAIVYDKANAKFYAQATSQAGLADVPDYNWIVLESSDGFSWGIVETIPGSLGGVRYASPIMTAAADPIYQDGDNNNCPGGVYGYDVAKKILMAPYPDTFPFAFGGRSYLPQVQIRKENEAGHRTFTYIDIPGMNRIVSVAFAGGMWQVAGSLDPGEIALIATSTDDGETWHITYSQDTPGWSGSSAMIVLGAA